MKNKKVTVIDYGIGNLFNVGRALEICGANEVIITSDVSKILSAERIILPGVGAFSDGMLGLVSKKLDEAIYQFIKLERPFLGICLGMQLLASKSFEFGDHLGLSLIEGLVEKIPSEGEQGQVLKVPYIGWSPLVQQDKKTWNQTILRDTGLNDSVYFVHSFHFLAKKESDILATYNYGGHDIAAVIKSKNITGVQFHPEKSGKVGLKILQNFINE